jgi:Methyl-accepting chemotaxis protein (MCP) signalling domain
MQPDVVERLQFLPKLNPNRTQLHRAHCDVVIASFDNQSPNIEDIPVAIALDQKPVTSTAYGANISESTETDSDVSALIARLTSEVNQIACEKTRSIQQITNQMKMLALNALIESSRAGAHGAGFAVVAQEVRAVGQKVEAIARDLEGQLTKRTGNLQDSIVRMTERSRGERMVDLSLNAVELIDRNLYERTCDVRWWATDSAMVDCAATPDAASVAHATERLAVILGAYTVYLDLWLCDLDGHVIANGRADRFKVAGKNVSATRWFREARTLRSGDDYVAGDIECQPLLGNAQVATYCASVREHGKPNGKPIGVLAIHFDWEAQARAIVQGVRVGAADKARVLLIDSNFRVIAASDGRGLLTEHVTLKLDGRRSGYYQDASGSLVAFHATPGYETYKGLGWYGVILGAG